jgi:hypothetical protein
MIETAADLDDLPPNGDLRQARVNVLPALHLSRSLPGCSSGRLQSASGAPKSVLTSRERCSKRVAPNAEVDGPRS